MHSLKKRVVTPELHRRLARAEIKETDARQLWLGQCANGQDGAETQPDNQAPARIHHATIGGCVTIDFNSGVGLVSLVRSGRGRRKASMRLNACSIAFAAPRSSRSPRKRPTTCSPNGMPLWSVPQGRAIAGFVTNVVT